MPDRPSAKPTADNEAAPLSAAQYAAFAKTDTATFIGMREAMGQAVVELKGRRIADGAFARTAAEALSKAVERNPELKAAGTRELVKRYFADVIDRQGGDKEARIRAFLGDISLSRGTLDRAQRGELSTADLASMGGQSLNAAKRHLGIKTLTEDFQAIIKKPAITNGLTVEPGALSDAQAKMLARLDAAFRAADRLDATFLGHPAVSQLLATVNPATEQELVPIIEAAVRLRDGKSDSVAADLAVIRQHAKNLTGKDQALPEDITLEQGKAIGRQVLNTVVQMRCETGATADDFLQILATKGQNPPKKALHEPQQSSLSGNPMDSLMGTFGKIASGGLGEVLALAAAMAEAEHPTQVVATDPLNPPPTPLGPGRAGRSRGVG